MIHLADSSQLLLLLISSSCLIAWMQEMQLLHRANRWQLMEKDRVPHHDRKKGTSPLNMVSARVQENSPLPG